LIKKSINTNKYIHKNINEFNQNNLIKFLRNNHKYYGEVIPKRINKSRNDQKDVKVYT